MTVLDRITPETSTEHTAPVLETERLTLRASRPDDAKMIATLANDRRVAENLRRLPHPYSLADAQSFVTAANATADEIALVITVRGAAAEPGDVVGACGIAGMDGETPEIGYWLGVPFWGNGYATEVARALVDYSFDTVGFEVLYAGARVSNPASRRVLEKCGFQWAGVGLYRVRALRSSAPVDRFRIDRGLWASLKRWGEAPRRRR
jgi:RimJ/RimL family protein N-acetyltransferase